VFDETAKLYTNEFFRNLARIVRKYIREWSGDSINKTFLPFVEVIFWILALYFVDWLLQKIFGTIFRIISNKLNFNWVKKFYQKKVFRTVLHFITLNLLIELNPYVFQRYQGIDGLTDKCISLLTILLVLRLIYRVIDAVIDINDEHETHTTVGVRTFGQLIKIFAAFFGAIYFIATLIDTEATQIFTFLGALTAVVLLIFRDSILGFVSGLQISSSKSIKVGDWVSVSKYHIEGTVKEINLAITKIENFDKTISTVPTYDLIASEVTNHSAMVQSNTKRIKRSIYFNVNSFEFCTPEMLNRFEKIDLIGSYLKIKQEEIKKSNQNIVNKDYVINGRQLTNIGIFRKYAENYLTNRTDISKSDKIIVRQLEQTAQGMPLEIMCFTTSADMVDFERIQSDVFDHLISASKEFDLTISQPFVIQQND
jgi:miniconductance mechanosensitive channel